jgi:hypothetical protein
MAVSDKMWVVLKIYCGRRRERTASPSERGPTCVVRFIGSKATSDELLVMAHIGAAAFDGVDRNGRINPDSSEMRGDSVQNKQVELIHVRPLVSLTR